MGMYLQPITKANFLKWHGEGALLLLGAGNAILSELTEKLSDYGIDFKAQGRQVTTATVAGKNHSIAMASNGCDEFIFVIDDMQGSDYSKSYHADTGKNHITVYVVA